MPDRSAARAPWVSIARSEHRVRVGGQTVPYRVIGEGEPVVMIHGLGGSSRCWAWSVPALASRYRVYLVDLPGFGVLRRLHRQFALSTASAWLAEWMHAADVGRAHLVGHSMGALIAARLAAELPGSVDRLILVSAAGVPVERSVLGCLRRLPAGWRHRAPGAWRLLLPDALLTRPTMVWRTARELLAQDVRATLREIRTPTLVLWGADDPLLPADCAEVFRREISGARRLLLFRAGHLPMLTRPQEFNQALLAFLGGAPVGD
ncbi:MAG TPA: alpha/beta fold hydrolase [Methylomirabilota bacterium]|jgi:pimeloyl-ACP methyl ester carboxylesterase